MARPLFERARRQAFTSSLLALLSLPASLLPASLLPASLLRASLLPASLLLVAPVARAQDELEPEERNLTDDERARELYLRGDRLYAEGSYDEAVIAFEQAYELSRRPPLLYDMANALERLGRYEEALHRLNQYVPSAPDHQRATVLKRIRSLEARAEEQRRRERAERAASAPSSPEASGARGPTAAPGPLAAAPAGDAAQPPSEAGSAPILGYALGGGGLASIGVGVVFGILASSARSDAEAQCVDSGSGLLCPTSIESKLSTADSRALVADLAIGVGLVAVGVGAYLVLSHDEDSGASTALRAGAAPDGGRMSLVTTF